MKRSLFVIALILLLSSAGSPTTIAAYSFTRDNNGNPLSQTASGQTPFGDDDRTFTVDRLNRLTDTTYTATSETESQTLDRVGNRESHTPRGGSPTAYALANAANEYATIGGSGVSYDAAGNLTVDEAGRQYFYDEQNRLTQIRASNGTTVLANYTYDGLGRRVRFEDPVAGITTRYYYDGPNVIEERDGSDVRVRYHVSGAQFVDEHIATFNDSSGIYIYYLSNDLYTVAAIGSASGSVIESYNYGAYGLSSPASSPCIRGDMDGDSVVDAADLPQFITVLLDGTTDPHELCAADLNGDFVRDGLDIQPMVTCVLGGPCPGASSGSPLRSAFTLHGRPVDVLDGGNLLLQYNRARYYDIRNGRWLQRDRAGYRDGPSLYESFRNNPTRLRDPLGEGVIDDILDIFYRYGTPEGAKQTIDEQTGVIPLDPITAASRERERMVIGTLGPPAQKIAETARQVAVRVGGAAGAVGGVGEATVGVVFFVPSFGASGVFVLHGADVSQAGVRQAATGEPVATFTYQIIAESGHPTAALVVDLGTSLASGGVGLLAPTRAVPAALRGASTATELTSEIRPVGVAVVGEARGANLAVPLFTRLQNANQRVIAFFFDAKPGEVVLGSGVSPGPITGQQLVFPFGEATRPQVVFRVLRPDEMTSVFDVGLIAKNPAGTYSPSYAVARGSSVPTQFIPTTRDINVALREFRITGQPFVAIDLGACK